MEGKKGESRRKKKREKEKKEEEEKREKKRKTEKMSKSWVLIYRLLDPMVIIASISSLFLSLHDPMSHPLSSTRRKSE